MAAPARGANDSPLHPAVRRTGRVSAPTVVSAIGCLLSVVGASSVFAQQGAITGTVTDAESLRPVAGAQVFVSGTIIGTLTGQEGGYRLESIPAGEATVTVRLIGYREASESIEVVAGEVVRIDFQVSPTALELQEIVVTGLAGETPRVKLPFSVERLDADDMPVPAADVSSLIASKAPGVRSMSGSGQPGVASDITLRGPTSIDASGRSQAPLIVIDGVIQSENATLADIGALDIDQVEIVKGAAASSMYGSRAQNGVIQITTRRARGIGANSSQFLARGEVGASSLGGSIDLTDAHPYVMNEDGTKFIDSLGNEIDLSDLGQQGVGQLVLKDGGTPNTAVADNPWPVLYDQIDRFYDPGDVISGYGAITGRFGESSFRASFEAYRESGIISCDECARNLDDFQADRVARGLEPLASAELPENDGYDRQNARVNVDSRLGDLELAASAFYSRSSLDDSGIEDGVFYSLSLMSRGLDLTELDPNTGLPRADVPTEISTNPLYLVAIGEHVDTRTRTMGSVDLRWTPTGWASLEAVASYDRTDFGEFDYYPKTTLGADWSPTGGSLETLDFVDEAMNASATLGVTRGLLDGDLTLRAKARYLLERQRFESSGVFGSRFSVEGVPNFGAIEGETNATNQVRPIKAEGYFAIGSLDYRGRYIVDALVRRDGSSLFGPEERWHTYYRGSAAWRPSQEDWWGVEAIDELKLRFSYGTAGGRPNFFAQYETYGVSGGGIFPVNLGNRALKPEFSVEGEVGVNLVLLGDVGVEYTHAWSRTEDQILQVPQPSYVGFSSQWQNAGEIESSTHEVAVRWAAIDRPALGLDLRFFWDRTTQRIAALNVPPYQSGPDNDVFYVAEGRALGEFWGKRWAESCGDLGSIGVSPADCAASFAVNSDGLVVWTGGVAPDQGIAQGLWGTSGEVANASFDWGMPIEVLEESPLCLAENGADAPNDCPLQPLLPLGNTTPAWNASFGSGFRYGGFNLALLLDAAIGFEIYNWTRQWALRGNNGADIGQIGKPEGEKKPIGYYGALYNVNQSSAFFVERGDWLKLREVSLGYTLPRSLTEGVFGGGIDRITVSVIGRNLLTVTGFRGYDPEVGHSGGGFGSTAITRTDAFQYPNFRTVTAALEVVF